MAWECPGLLLEEHFLLCRFAPEEALLSASTPLLLASLGAGEGKGLCIGSDVISVYRENILGPGGVFSFLRITPGEA